MGWQMSVPLQGGGVAGFAHRPRREAAYSAPGWEAFWIRTSGAFSEDDWTLLPFSPCCDVLRRASSVVRYLGDRPKWLRYRLRLADSVDVSYRGCSEITVLRSCATLDIVWNIVTGTLCVKRYSAPLDLW